VATLPASLFLPQRSGRLSSVPGGRALGPSQTSAIPCLDLRVGPGASRHRARGRHGRGLRLFADRFWPLAALSLPVYAATVVGSIGLAIWAAERMCQAWGTDDDGRIVADEIAGQLVTLLPLVAIGRADALGWVVTGFVLFRVYDVWKPGPVRWLEENLPGGIGVVMDDVLAGVFGALTLAALVWLVPMVVGK
jgi:phosphatidylglycerophosphatase A